MKLTKKLLVFVALIGTVTLAMARVRVDHDPTVDFSKYKTYA